VCWSVAMWTEPAVDQFVDEAEEYAVVFLFVEDASVNESDVVEETPHYPQETATHVRKGGQALL